MCSATVDAAFPNVSVHVLGLATDVRFIHLNLTTQHRSIDYLHCVSNSVAQIPRGLVSANPQVTLQLFCADSLFRIQYQSDCLEPHYERKMGIVEDRAGRGSEFGYGISFRRML